ncbi:peptidoglycan-binding domain-containing protein [Streptomyces sp. CBMA123]|uniref:peptidoglycan-binding domain-containing protein n=1 Tax=Streptomyces sp. CBMA123 TaxID=1896313 RepID=UPI001661E474|nr:peptidoglycan-binding protein [Streptomyces sp. CBMA123]MBD0694142.1 lysin [Streptomyces sp. CBMA123]
MRSNALVKTLVGATAVVGLAVGSLAGAGAAFAATPPGVHQEAASTPTAQAAVVNLGLSVSQAQKLQVPLRTYWGYTGAIDGRLGTGSWQAMQRFLRADWGYTDSIDGIVGAHTVEALQRWLKSNWGYTGAIDGIAGAGTEAAFARYCDSL